MSHSQVLREASIPTGSKLPAPIETGSGAIWAFYETVILSGAVFQA